MMWVKIIKPKQGFGYFPGDLAEFPAEKAEEMIKEGFAISADEPEAESDLPAELSSREILIKAGLVTIDQVLAAKETLTDIKGIGEKTAADIIAALTKEA